MMTDTVTWEQREYRGVVVAPSTVASPSEVMFG